MLASTMVEHLKRGLQNKARNLRRRGGVDILRGRKLDFCITVGRADFKRSCKRWALIPNQAGRLKMSAEQFARRCLEKKTRPSIERALTASVDGLNVSVDRLSFMHLYCLSLLPLHCFSISYNVTVIDVFLATSTEFNLFMVCLDLIKEGVIDMGRKFKLGRLCDLTREKRKRQRDEYANQNCTKLTT